MGSSGKRVVGNTIIMYIQLVLNVLIGLVSVRIIFNALGQSDYGVYDVIGGIVGLLSFISNSLAQSSMRFISVSLGKGDKKETNGIYNACFWLHLGIATALCVLLEVVGFFLFDGFLNIPADRVYVAKVVYQYMVISLFIKVNCTPLKAVASSYEEFWYVASVSITESILKLVVALIISNTQSDKLLIYGFLMMVITAINYCMYIVFNSIRHREIIQVHKPMIAGISSVAGFASWTLLDTFSSVVNRQGYAIMLNKFFGPVMNSAFAVSRQLEGHIFTISSAVTNSIKPQIMKSHGVGDDSRMYRLSMTAGKFGFSLMSLVAIPLIMTMPEVLQIWLKNVPEYAVLFSRLLIIACMIEQLTRGLVHANQALGNIKWFSISISFVRFLARPLSVIVLALGASAPAAIYVFLVCESIGSFSRVFVLSRISHFKPSLFFKEVLIPILAPTIISVLLCMLSYYHIKGIVGIILAVLVTIASYSTLFFFLGLSRQEKEALISFVRERNNLV